MQGTLVQPRVYVQWKDLNLSSYNGNDNFPAKQPLVYNVEVQLEGETSAPTGSMKWDPTGAGYAIYEKLISDKSYMNSPITVIYYFPAGKVLTLPFVWAGQSIDYGTNMTVTVKLRSELDGLINANIRNVGHAYDKGSEANGVDVVNKLITMFDIRKKDIIKYTPKAKNDLNKYKINNQYKNDSTFASAVDNAMKQNGNISFANNIGEPNITIYTPFTWNTDQEEVKNGATDIPEGKGPDPAIRYGYLIGPSVIQSIQRTYEWKPPQQTNSNTPATQIFPQPRNEKGQYASRNPPSIPQQNAASSNKATSAPQGPANARSNPGISNAKNVEGPLKQLYQNYEKAATMSFQTFLTPVLVGIKPHDIIYIPDFKGDYIEDWIVHSVSYDQNDGRVTVGIQATRVYGQGAPMNEKMGKKFLEYAKSQKLVGPDATLDAWDSYAWQPFA